MKSNILPKIREFKVKRPKDRKWKSRLGLGMEQMLIQYHNARYPWKSLKRKIRVIKIGESFEKEVWKVGFFEYHIRKQSVRFIDEEKY